MSGFGAPHRHFLVTDSTNSRARELAVAGAPEGTVVTADLQSAGRGRQGRAWVAPAGKALLYSAISRTLDERFPLLPLAAALAVCEAAEELAPGAECLLKWPNDVWLDGGKLAGILIEAHPRDWAVIGVGLNLTTEPSEFPPELRATATSLRAATAAPARDLTPERARLALDAALTRWASAPAGRVLAAWRERDALRGREISWSEGSGVAVGIDDRGNLLVAVPDGGRVVLSAGEVHLGAV